ncbi:MAG TPA: bifunctional demethylmenaquinone methyltransferase/2-methoxy-6-polyprenyl-1,4-benzoquinol methylase UbiE [Bacillota bacterium]
MDHNRTWERPDLPGEKALIRIKATEMKEIFDRIARRYDLANTIMSMGRHHYWRRSAVSRTELKSKGRALDLCCGTGMITADLAKQVGPDGRITGMDLSGEMLAIARRHLQKWGLLHQVQLVQGDAGKLPFRKDSFDCVTIGYGLRNVPDPVKVLQEAFRVLKPDGRIVVLETAKPLNPFFGKAYFFYLRNWIPLVGKILCHQPAAYQYLHDSIAEFFTPNEVIRFFYRAGFEDVDCTLLTLGIVGVYTGRKKR